MSEGLEISLISRFNHCVINGCRHNSDFIDTRRMETCLDEPTFTCTLASSLVYITRLRSLLPASSFSSLHTYLIIFLIMCILTTVYISAFSFPTDLSRIIFTFLHSFTSPLIYIYYCLKLDSNTNNSSSQASLSTHNASSQASLQYTYHVF